MFIGFQKTEGKFLTICDGAYMITTNIMIRVDAAGYYQLAVTFDGKESTLADVTVIQANRVATLNIYQVFKWTKGMVIELKLKSSTGRPITVLKSSSWSMGFIGETNTAFREFSSFFTHNQTFPSTGSFIINRVLSVDLTTLENNLKTPNYSPKGQFISPSGLTLNQLQRFEVGTTDLFYITAILHIIGPASDLQAVIAVSKVAGEVGPNDGVSARFTKTANGDTSVTLSGIFLIQRSQFVSVFVTAYDGGAFTIQDTSFLSVINMRYIVSSVSARLSNAITIASAAWQDLHSQWRVQGQGLYSFGKDFDNINGKFTASHSGIHSVHANIQFVLQDNVIGTANNKIHALMTIDGIEDTQNGFYSVINGPKKFVTLKIFGFVNLRAGQLVALKVKSDSATTADTYSLSERTSFSISYIGPQWAVPSFFAQVQTFTGDTYTAGSTVPVPYNKWSTSPILSTSPFQTNNQFNNSEYLADSSGIYVVSVSVVFTSIACSSSGLFQVHGVTSGGSFTFNKEIGLKDQRLVRGGTNGGEITLSFSSAVQLLVGEKVGVKIQGGATCSFTISTKSTFSLAKWSETTNPSNKPLKYVGLLARTSAPTTYTTTIWNQLGQNILDTSRGLEIRGNYKPGLFLLGQQYNKLNSDFDVREPGIFFISGCIHLFNAGSLNGRYEISVQIDNQDVTSGLYATVTQQDSSSISLTFAGSIYLTLDQRVRIAVRGSAGSYELKDGTTFSLVKLQPDYKTPGVILEDNVNTLTATGNSYDINSWSADNTMGLTIR